MASLWHQIDFLKHTWYTKRTLRATVKEMTKGMDNSKTQKNLTSFMHDPRSICLGVVQILRGQDEVGRWLKSASFGPR